MPTKPSPSAGAPQARVRKPAASPAAAKTTATPTPKAAAAPKQVAAAPQVKAAKADVPSVTASEQASVKANKKPAKQRPVLVRDSFTMPEADFALLSLLKSKALSAQRAAKKSELLRAGLQLLATLDNAALVAALDRLEAVKTGRPKKKG